MDRKELLSSRDFWINQIQNDLYGIIEEYMKKNDLNRTELAKSLGVTKGYITQVLKGDFDHKISKMVDLSLSSGKAPLLYFIDLNKFIKDDFENKYYEVFPVIRTESIQFSSKNYSNSYVNMISDATIKLSAAISESITN